MVGDNVLKVGARCKCTSLERICIILVDTSPTSQREQTFRSFKFNSFHEIGPTLTLPLRYTIYHIPDKQTLPFYSLPSTRATTPSVIHVTQIYLLLTIDNSSSFLFWAIFFWVSNTCMDAVLGYRGITIAPLGYRMHVQCSLVDMTF